MSNLVLNKDGKIDIAIVDAIELNDAERSELARLERATTQLRTAEDCFKQEIVRLETKLMNNPDYANLQKMQQKIVIARRMARENQTVMNYRVSEAMKRAGVASPAELYAQMLPDAPPKEPRRRGRPRRDQTPLLTDNN